MANRQVELIKERLSILDVVGSYVELHKAGRHYKGKSPFTNEKTPSFFVSPERGMYYCFSSQKGGDLFTFIQEMEGVDFKGALTILAERAGVELTPEDPKQRDARATQFALLEAATTFFFKQRDVHPRAVTYVTERGVTGETQHAWRIGYAPDAWRALREHLTAEKFSDEAMIRAGLIKQTDGGKEPYDVFRDRIMFPIADPSGRIIAFSGRTLKADDQVPKYVNSPETELFQKSEVLYGYDKAKQGIRQYDFSLIVEGQFDVVLAHQAGYTNAVAVSGTALTEHHVMLLSRLSSRAVLALDADRAGLSAVKRSAALMLARGMDVKVARLPAGKDPADLIRDGAQSFKQVIGTAMHVIEFLLAVLKESAKDVRAYKLRAREEILPLVVYIPNRIDREHFASVVAEAIQTTKEAINFELERIATNESAKQPVEVPKKVEKERIPSSRKRDLLLYCSVLKDIVATKFPVLKDAYGKEFELLISNLNTLPEITQEEESRLVITAEQYLDSIPERQALEEFGDHLTELSHLLARDRLAELRKEIGRAEAAGDEARLAAALTATKEIERSLQSTISFQNL